MASSAVDAELVQLYIYDLSGGLARTFSQMLLGRQIEAIYHTSVVVAGMEHYFGGGLNVARAGATPFGRPVQVVDLGYTQLPLEVREMLLAELSERYTPESYSLWANNCNNFSDEFAQLLCGASIPAHITGLPAEVLSTPFGQMIQPMLAGLEQQLRSMRQQAYHPAIPGASGAAALAEGGAAGAAAAQAEPAIPSAAAAPAAVPAEPAAPAAAGAALAAAAGAVEQQGAGEGPALHAAEVEIEAAVAAGMIQEAEQALQSLQVEPLPAAAAAAETERTQPPGAVPPAAAAPLPGGPQAAAATVAATPAAGDKLAVELAVEAEYERLVAAGGLSEHEAQAAALEHVAADLRRRQGQQGEGSGGAPSSGGGPPVPGGDS